MVVRFDLCYLLNSTGSLGSDCFALDQKTVALLFCRSTLHRLYKSTDMQV